MNNKNKIEDVYRKTTIRIGSLRFLIAVIALAGFFLSAAPLAIEAAPGDLDPTFGSGGKVLTPIGNNPGNAFDVVVQSDGKIVMVGVTGSLNGANNDFAVVRYNPDGTLDNSFGTGGTVTTDISPYDVAFAVALQPDGKIVVAGRADDSFNVDFAVVRYNPDGTLDSLFGTGGKVITPVSNSTDYANDVVIQSDGKIVAVGQTNSGTNTATNFDFAVVRYNSDGTLDASFGTGGKVVTDFGSSGENASDVAVQSNGKIVVAGSGVAAGANRFAVARYNPDGSLDASFGTGGKVITLFGANGFAEAVAIQSDGKIVLAGNVGGASIDIALIRYNSDGSLDNSFGTGGTVRTDFGSFESAKDVEIQSNGKIVAVGKINSTSANGDFITVRYNTDGTLDSSFGAGGKVITDFGANDNADAVAIQADGKIVAAGSSISGSINLPSRFAVARYLGDSAATRAVQFDFDGDGKADVSVFRPENGAWYLNQSASGFTGVQFGINTDRIVPADYDGDGRADIAVFRDGFWYRINSSDNQFVGVKWGQTGDVPVPADYDGDSKADLAVFRSGNWYILQSSNNQFRAVQFGISTDKPVPADFDGDGKTDVAVFRDGNWYWLQSTNNQFRGVQFGQAGDKPVVGDYDGDSKADQAVFRNGIWYLNRSTAGFTGVQFGLSTDIPTPADYDGDGKTDVAVFRNGFWYRLNSSNNQFFAVQFGILTDKAIPSAFIP